MNRNKKRVELSTQIQFKVGIGYADLKASCLSVCQLPKRWRAPGQETALANEFTAQSLG